MPKTMDERLRQLEIMTARMDESHKALTDVVREIKDNHLAHLSADIKGIASDFKEFQKVDLGSHESLSKKIDDISNSLNGSISKLMIKVAAIGGGIAVIAALLQLAVKLIK